MLFFMINILNIIFVQFHPLKTEVSLSKNSEKLGTVGPPIVQFSPKVDTHQFMLG